MLITTTIFSQGSSTLLEPSGMVEIHPLLDPSLPTCLEANLEKVQSWNFSLGGWDQILLTGKQLGI